MAEKKTRQGIKDQSLQQRKLLLKYVLERGPVDTGSIIADLHFSRSVVFSWLRGMLSEGRVTMRKECFGRGQRRSFWAAGENTAPLETISLGGNARVRDPSVVRHFSKAKQIGMQRDPMIEAVFGQARAAA